MTFSLIDQALNVVMTGLVYGSEMWIACAFGLFVATREPDIERDRQVERALPQSVHPTVDQGEIEIIIEQRHKQALSRASAPEQIRVQDISRQETVEGSAKGPVEKLTEELVEESAQKAAKSPQRKTNRKTSQETKSRKAKPAVEAVSKPAHRKQKGQEQNIWEPATSASIVCEPVNWKRWKVADLRKASIAKVCGVRIRPIGSRRNLSKADLIAQYEQQMRRLTKSPTKRTRQEEVA